MAKQSLTVNMRIDGARQTIAAFRRLPKEASQELRERTLELSAALAVKAKSAGIADGRQSALVATTVKARKDRLPSIEVGGSKRVGRNRAPAYALLFGSEFGMNRRTGWYAASRFRSSTGRQFRPHRGQKGYWFFPTVEKEQSSISKAWDQTADSIVDKFTAGDISGGV